MSCCSSDSSEKYLNDCLAIVLILVVFELNVMRHLILLGVCLSTEKNLNDCLAVLLILDCLAAIISLLSLSPPLL